ncbi:MAG TPA: chorismate-binding protein, partial [Gemmatimonadaceae bacterium]|nr:chorismate-binding protein [Gemmatimonadaceae bacterium]
MSLEDFKRRAAGARLVPVWADRVLDTDTPVSTFAKLRRGPFAFLLESAPAGGETWARYTFLGTEPRAAWRLAGDIVSDWTADLGWHNERRSDNPLTDLELLIASPRPAEVPELGPFWSGAVGFFGYDVVRLVEDLPATGKKSADIPDAVFVFTRSLVILDNLRSTARVVISVVVPDGATDRDLDRLYTDALTEIEDVFARAQSPSALEPLALTFDSPQADGRSSYERDAFVRDVEHIKEYIAAGDCFQVLLSRRIEVVADFDTTDLYRALRAINPSPYMYHLILGDLEIVGSSPELLVRVADQRVTLRPIAGTRPRGSDAAADELMSAELLADHKERAEHVMLVDLGRNDVGRIAEFGSVEVTELMKVEKYSHVLHIVSQVEGALREGLSALDVFRATFPAGTMTGAPKVRAMEIIDELEPTARGAYAGALGYIAAGGKRMDLAITI